MDTATTSQPIADTGQMFTTDVHSDMKSRLAIAEAMLEYTPDGIALFDSNSYFVAANSAFATLTELPAYLLQPGVARGEMEAYAIANGLFGPLHEFVSVQSMHDRPMAEQRTRSYRLRHDGRMMQIIQAPRPDGSFVLTMLPITDLLSFHQDAAERSEILQAVMSHARCGIALFDSKGRLSACNEISQQFNPYPDILLTAGTKADAFLALIAQRARERGDHAILRWAAQGAAQDRSKPTHHRRRSLPEGWVDVYSDPTPDGGFMITHIDVTELVNAKIASDATTLELEALIGAMPGALIRQRRNPDGSWNRFYVSARITDLTGHSRQEASDPDWVVHNTDPGDFTPLLEGVLQAYSGGQSVVEFRFRQKSKQWIWIRAMMRGYADNSDVAEAICIWSDITREHELKEELTQSRRLAQMGEVATGMAHEMNQPLTSISIAAENARRALQRLPHSASYLDEKLALITDQAHRASTMIDHVQSFNRRVNSKPGVVMLNPILTAVAKKSALTLQQYQVQFVIRSNDNLPEVIGHEPSLERALGNFVTNSCEAYARNPAVEIGMRVITLECVDEDRHIKLIFRDQAGGIADHVLPRIFEPFFTTKPVGEGTGLGLSAAYGIIVGSGGAISIKNIDGGVEFHLSLLRAL
jgi:signal transduction histidine kinase